MNSNPVADQTITLRPSLSEDEPFLFMMYASTRSDEMALVDWATEQKEAFLRMQFNAQRQYYLDQYPTAEVHIILSNGIDIGRLIVDHQADMILLMDIALIPEHRNHGVGTALIKGLMAQARLVNKPIRLHVEMFNPAQYWYERMGFSKIRVDGIHYEMEWQPGVSAVND